MANFDVETKKKLDPRLAVDPSGKEFIINVAGAQVTPRSEPATSKSLSTINFQITPSSPSSVIDRSIIVETHFTFNFAGQTGDDAIPLLRRGISAARGFNHAVQSTVLTINGLAISQETQAIQHALSHFSEDDHMVHKQTISPSWMGADYVQAYPVIGPQNVINSLATYEDSTRARFGRGCYDMEITTNTRIAAVVKVKFYEYMTLSPLNYSGDLMPGLTNVTSLGLTFNLANLERMFIQGDGTITGLSPAGITLDEATCHLTELSFPVYLNVPPVVTTSYTDIQRQTTAGGQIAAGNTRVLSSNSYQLNTVPHSIIVYAKTPDSELYANVKSKTEIPDAYGVIEKIEIQYNNQSSILGSASPIQLFQMSSRNGIDLSWQEFSGKAPRMTNAVGAGSYLPLCGSLVCLSFGHDISSNDPTAISGTSVNSNFSVKATVRNNNTADKNYDLTILYVYEGVLSIAPGQAYKYTSLLTRDETLNLEIEEGSEISGGAVDFKSLLKKAKSGLKKAAPYLKPFASTALDVGSQAAAPYVSSAPALRETIKSVHGLGLQGGNGAGMSAGQLVQKSRMSTRMVR
jgi:hypothetical protein